MRKILAGLFTLVVLASFSVPCLSQSTMGSSWKFNSQLVLAKDEAGNLARTLEVGAVYSFSHLYGDHATFRFPSEAEIIDSSLNKVVFSKPGRYYISMREEDSGIFRYATFDVYLFVSGSLFLSVSGDSPKAGMTFDLPKDAKVGYLALLPEVTSNIDSWRLSLVSGSVYSQRAWVFSGREIDWGMREDSGEAPSGADALGWLVITDPEKRDRADVSLSARIGYWLDQWETYPKIEEVSFSPLADTYVNAWDPNASYGQEGELRIRSNGDQSVLMRFDLSSIPDGAFVLSADLQMAIIGDGVNPMITRVLKAVGPWDEKTTWATRPGIQELPAREAWSGLVDQIQELVDSREVADFWVLGQSSSNVSYAYASREYWDQNRRPVLKVVYFR